MPAAGHPARRHPRRLRLRPPRRRSLGHPAARRRRAARPGPAPARPRPQGHPRRRDHQQREPVLPPDTAPAAGARAARPHRHQGAGRGPRPQDRRAGPLQARPPHQPTTHDGYHRVQCPAAMGKIRCPLRPASMTLDRDRPEILTPPEHPQACCAQQTITVPPDVLAKTAQKHDYPSAAWRRSYARRTGAERGFATAKDPASNDISPRLVPPHGPGAPHAVHHHAARRPQPAHPARLEHPAGRNPAPRAAKGLPPKTRKRRRKTLAMPRRRAALTRAARPRATRPPPPARTAATSQAKACPEHRTNQRNQAQSRHTKPGTTTRSHQQGRNVRPKRENRPH